MDQKLQKRQLRCLQTIGIRYSHTFHFKHAAIGGEAIDKYRNPLPDETLDVCEASDAVLLGAVGGPKWDQQSFSLTARKRTF